VAAQGVAQLPASERSAEEASGMENTSRVIYCNCTYAKVVPEEVKREVLERLSASELAFDAVPDLCEMSARKDPALERFANSGSVQIVACYPRAVRWLFHAAGTPLAEKGVEVLNMRDDSAERIFDQLVTLGKPAAKESP